MENILTSGRRQREEELIWRGQQFVRAIRLYYRKTGHYPSTLDDLKKGMPELHFLRYAAYKDPMKSGDERAWRFIYVNAAGQIIGSVRYATLQQMALLDLNGGKIPGVKQADQGDQPGIPVSSLADQSNANSSSSEPAEFANATKRAEWTGNAKWPELRAESSVQRFAFEHPLESRPTTRATRPTLRRIPLLRNRARILRDVAYADQQCRHARSPGRD